MSDRGIVGLLVVGVVAGALLAGLSLRRPGEGGALPAHAAAVVGGRTIEVRELERTVARVRGELRSPPSAERLRQKVLDRLIDEELLVQYGLQLGLAERDPQIRTLLGAAVVDLVLARSDRAEPDEATLRRYWRDNQRRFQRDERLQVAHRAFSDRQASAALAWPAVPRTPLPQRTLRNYLPASVVSAATQLPVGASSHPIEAGGAWHVVEVVARHHAEPAFDRAMVLAEYRRDVGDAALRRFLAKRRAMSGAVLR